MSVQLLSLSARKQVSQPLEARLTKTCCVNNICNVCAKMPPKSKAKSVSAECDLCCQQFEKDNERLKCEGACGAVVHRYCAGVREPVGLSSTDTVQV